MPATVTCERRDSIAIVRIERPHVRNAVDLATARQLAQAFRDFDADESADVAILTADGDRVAFR